MNTLTHVEVRVPERSVTADVAVSGLRATGILAVLVVLAWSWLRWRRRHCGDSSRRLQLIDRLTLGAQREVVIVRVDGRELVLGVTGQGIRALADTTGRGSDGSLDSLAAIDSIERGGES